mgnify:CR=1 FL=1
MPATLSSHTLHVHSSSHQLCPSVFNFLLAYAHVAGALSTSAASQLTAGNVGLHTSMMEKLRLEKDAEELRHKELVQASSPAQVFLVPGGLSPRPHCHDQLVWRSSALPQPVTATFEGDRRRPACPPV